MREQDYQKQLYILLIISFITRAFLAAWHELGNDEVYYYTYALYPDWSHFDHPPMIGWVIQFFSLNLTFDHEFFLRMPAVVFVTINTWLIYQSGCLIGRMRAGWYAALLYTASVYAFVITGFMILPDAPQNFFWTLSLWLMLKTVHPATTNNQRQWLWALLGMTIGLGMISKYTAVFLWFGYAVFVILYHRRWLRQPMLWIAVLISAAFLIPVVWWNFSNDFVSFSFQGERINIFNGTIRPDLFFTELGGQMIYNNPVVFVIAWISVFALWTQKSSRPTPYHRLLLWLSLPLILLFLFFSLFRSTLPHWTGPAYTSLILLSADFLEKRSRRLFPFVTQIALAILMVFILIGSLQIKTGFIPMKKETEYHRLGKNDVTLDMFGWRSLKPAFESVRNRLVSSGEMDADDAIIGENWFPLANLDYYVARPLGMKVFGLGEPQRLHKYMWINNIRGGMKVGDDFWYITSSRDYKHPDEVYTDWFDQIIPADTLQIKRSGQVAKRYFIFLLKDLKSSPPDYLLAK